MWRCEAGLPQDLEEAMDGLDEVTKPGTQTDAESQDKLGDFRHTLQTDRLIKVYVAENATPYLVPGVILTSISEYFVKALAYDKQLGGREDGTLRFPEDDQDTWEIMLYWKIKGELYYDRPTTKSAVEAMFDLFVRCWISGDKYGIEEFQDLIIIELIDLAKGTMVPLTTVKLAFENTLPKSALRALMAEEAVSRIRYWSDYKHEDLAVMDGVIGWSTELMQALDHYRLDESSIIFEGRTSKPKRWARYMVGDGPKKHWIFDEQ